MASDKIMQAFMPKAVETRKKIELVNYVMHCGDGISLSCKIDNDIYYFKLDVYNNLYEKHVLFAEDIDLLKRQITNKMLYKDFKMLSLKDYYIQIDDSILQKITKIVDKIVEGYRNTEKLIKELDNETK